MPTSSDPIDLRERVVDAINVLKKQSPFDSLRIEIHPKMGDIEAKNQQTLLTLIDGMIEQDGSHAVVGNYVKSNTISRPENTLVILGEVEVILNVSSDQLQIVENNAGKEALHLIQDLVVQLGEVFVFASGKGVIETLTDLDYDNRSDNIVFIHDTIDMERLDSIVSSHQFVDLTDYDSDDFTKEQIQAFAMLLWGYDPSNVTDLSNPHIVMINEDLDVMGGARANAITENYGVIGGVKTLKPFRNQGVGTSVSQILTAKLREMDLQPVLETDNENTPALKIYEKLGYQKVGQSIFLDFGTDVISSIRGDRDY